ncbi:hypothetical protein HJC99_06900 [Candidatus Saccharibacteria bacterium]|nr:hypothetical protein [Candidatus Saccharibacteria bacterium]
MPTVRISQSKVFATHAEGSGMVLVGPSISWSFDYLLDFVPNRPFHITADRHGVDWSQLSPAALIGAVRASLPPRRSVCNLPGVLDAHYALTRLQLQHA